MTKYIFVALDCEHAKREVYRILNMRSELGAHNALGVFLCSESRELTQEELDKLLDVAWPEIGEGYEEDECAWEAEQAESEE